MKREDLFITSKLWNSFHEKERVEEAVRQTLKDLKIDHLDLFVIHWPVSFTYESKDVNVLELRGNDFKIKKEFLSSKIF